ncbi:Aste57867_11444 [Aphanomyces stellatus]|uniref:Aste57867_11444 protein n=1 Tax=Aphanomyces stellatus TaxID=120398 RepID=A0A485KU56_9STRA|nr:hypothetical protein As57867_011402 [Aphanomyces stellatus]VFT88305.1 Aste57867_11444 [Aphanomyces stellatus]
MLLVGYTIRSMYLGAAKRRGYGPFMLCLFAFPLVMMQPVLQVMQSLHYFNSYGPMTKLINAISWLGVAQMSTASLWNAGADIYLLGLITRRFGSSAAAPEAEETEFLMAVAPIEEEAECGD